jgi:hypothetical protein
MAWWKRTKPCEAVSADWMGEKFAEIFDPRRTLGMIVDAHPLLTTGDRAFLALASMRLVGFQLGAMQKSVTGRISRPIMEKLQLSFIGSMLNSYAESRAPPCNRHELISDLLKLGKQVHDAFMANRNIDPTAGIHPVWFAGKEVCMFLTQDRDRLNPGEIQTYAEYLHDTIGRTTKLFNELLDAHTEFVV